MKKLLFVLVCALLFACAPKEEPTTLRILSPKGAPALALAQAAVNEEATVSFIDGTDLLTTELAKESGDYDILVGPINLGAKLIQDGKTDYRIAGIVTWGNLYLVGSKDIQETDIITAFGQGAVPDKVMLEIFKRMGINNNIEYFPSVTEVQAQLLSNKTEIALIAEPAATATIAKAKGQEKELKILLDFQKEWTGISGNEGYPQAALFVRAKQYDKYEKQINALLEKLVQYCADQKTNPEKVRSAIDVLGAETIGVPSADLVIKTYPRLNVNYKPASEAVADMEAFLSIFGITYKESFLLP